MSYKTQAVREAMVRQIADPRETRSPVERYAVWERDLVLVFKDGTWCTFSAELDGDGEPSISIGRVSGVGGDGFPLWLLVEAGLITDAERAEACTFHELWRRRKKDEWKQLARLKTKYEGGES